MFKKIFLQSSLLIPQHTIIDFWYLIDVDNLYYVILYLIIYWIYYLFSLPFEEMQ